MNDTIFQLDPQLEQDSYHITDLDLCEVRLINNIHYPWIILVPRLVNITEITDLDEVQYIQLSREIRYVTAKVQQVFSPHKINIATIGNIVKQMHIHIVARFEGDIGYPQVVWGKDTSPYSMEEVQALIQTLLEVLV